MYIKMLYRAIARSAMLCFLSVFSAHATSVSLPYSFTAGSPISASQMMGNFASITSALSSTVSSPWVPSSSNIYFNTGSVGIGSSAPGHALDVNGSVSVAGAISASGTVSNSGAYASTYHLDTTPASISIANNGTVNIPSFSGMVVVNNYVDGHVTLYLCGGGYVTAVGSVAGQCGTMTYNSNVSGYMFTNNSGSTATFGFFIIRTRPTA